MIRVNRTTEKPMADVNNSLLSFTAEGSVDWPRTLRLAKQSAADGVDRAIITTKLSNRDFLRSRFPQLQSLLDQHAVALSVTAAIELALHEDLFDHVIHTATVMGELHRRYVFLRVPGNTPMPVAPVVDSLQRMGVTTILISPERVGRFRRNPDELSTIVRLGGRLQISASSLLDQTDPSRIQFCRQLIRDRLCHFVASESGQHHDLPISLSEAWGLIARWEGPAMADAVCCDNGANVFRAEEIPELPSRPSRLRVLADRLRVVG